MRFHGIIMFILSCILIDINIIVIRFMKTNKFYLFGHVLCTFLINFFIWLDIIIRNFVGNFFNFNN